MMGSNYASPPALASIMCAASYFTDTEEKMPWESKEGWVPRTKAEKQKSPNHIRNKLQRYIDDYKFNKSKTQSFILSELGINNNSFGKRDEPPLKLRLVFL